MHGGKQQRKELNACYRNNIVYLSVILYETSLRYTLEKKQSNKNPVVLKHHHNFGTKTTYNF